MTITLAATLLLLAVTPQDVPNATLHHTFSVIVYADHNERHLSRVSVDSHNITYTSSISVTAMEYGTRAKRCQYTFSNFELSRRFAVDILHQAKPYGVRHMRFGMRSWMRIPPISPGEVKGSCASALGKIITPAAIGANALGPWKDVIDQDDAVVRHFLGTGRSNPHR